MGMPWLAHMLKLMLWEALRALWLGPIRSKRSAEGGCVEEAAGA